ncbi:glycosyltransferase [Candidatus Gottesmanbacteria bacterium]|nr:glycosyltransferase [Candidatus Gottesmanbacteria bacterium]
MKLVHIIPTYNEKENIGQMIEILEKLGKNYPQWKTEILIVDDYSPDRTADIVRNYQKKFSNVHLISKKKEGLGRALIEGYEYAQRKLKANVIIPNDADFQWDPRDYPKLVEKIQAGFDVVIASRHVPGAKVIGWNWFRKLNHDISNSLLAFWLAGVHEVADHAGNFKAIRVKGVLDEVPLSRMENVGFSFQLHILYELSKVGAKFTEVPVIFKERKSGQSKIGFNRYYLRDVLEYIRSSILIRLDRSARFFKYCLVGLIGFVVQSLISKFLIFLTVNPGIAVSCGAEGAIVSNFIFNNLWTFKHKRIIGSNIINKFIQFNMVSVGSVIIQGIIVGIGTFVFGVSSWFFFMVGAIVFIVIPYSFFMYNRYIWKTHK